MSAECPRPDSRPIAFVEEFTKSTRRIYAFIRVLISDPVDADDVFQQTSKVLWEKFDQFQPGTDFRAWAFQIARFEALRYRRDKRQQAGRFPSHLEELLDAEAEAAGDSVDQRSRALAQCLQKLAREDRQLVELRYQHGSTTQAVAGQLTRSTDAVYRALRRIHKLLYECVDRALREELS